MDVTNSVLPPRWSTIARAHDEPYWFGRQPTSRSPLPLKDSQFARQPIVRGRVRELGSSYQRVAA